MNKIIKNIIKKIRNTFRIFIIHMKDIYYDCKYCGFYRDTDSKIPWRILLLSHSLEKGLSMPNKRTQFGEGKAKDLIHYLDIYNSKDDFVFLEGVSVLNAYVDYRKSNNLSYKEFKIPNLTTKYTEGGVKLINKDDLNYNFENFEKLCKIRHSVREYSEDYVTKKEIEKAISIAKTTPTACNRQMIKVYFTENEEANQELSMIIPGNTGFKDEKTRYLFLTADRNAFDYYELEQWYLNGGIFLSYLQLAFTAEQIGSCIYQWPKNSKLETKAKKILNIPKNEIIVSVLGIGHYKDEFLVLDAARKDIDDILIEGKKEE